MADMGSDFDDRFDAVIAIEDVNFSGGGVALSEDVLVTPGSLVEPKGGTIYKGELLARKGFRLSSIDIANLTTAGVRRLDILKKPRVAFIPTGKDLVPGGDLPARGQAVDCNSAMTRAVLSGFGAEVVLFPIVKDVPGELECILHGAMESCDIVLIGGGSSKGTGDFCPRLIKGGSQFYNHYVKARPGRPIVTAVNGDKPIINIPGPAFSAFFPLQWCVRGLIEHWFGLNGTPRPKIFARAKDDLMLDCLPLAYGLFFQVGTEGGEPVASPLDERVRGELFMKANAYAILPIGSPGFRAGDVLELYPID
jgi:molybdopterin molybdotransferase/putative molybdopterin biosynthesis protein